MMSELNLIDVYRTLHPDTHRYTWRRKNPLKQARLDYFLTSNSFQDLVNKCEIGYGNFQFDHRMIRSVSRKYFTFTY